MEAARALLGERGAQGFSLADAAKLAGVSPAAPYRHFRDRDALLGEVAKQGFALFGQRLSAALAGSQDPSAGFQAMGRAYLAFAREEPGLYEAMFSWCAAPARAEGEPGTPAGAFDILLDGIAGALAAAGKAVGDPRTLALQVWALSHGVATLAAAGQLGPQVDPDRVLEDGVAALIAGQRPSGAASAPR
ncbi:TetR/AcrR family transcriptional regulator [Alsobacter sp. R-9]